jgi:lysozyme family protein
MVFDEAVNQGVGRALASLQSALSVAAFGPATQAALAGADPAQLIRAIATDREAHYRALPTIPRFGRGWLARLDRTTGLALGTNVTQNPLVSASAGMSGLYGLTAPPSGSRCPGRTG